MALMEKYQTLIDLANRLGISGLNTVESDGVLNIEGVAASADAKQQLWDEYGRIDPDYRSGEVVLNVSAPEGNASSSGSGQTYTVTSGDTLGKIGSKYGVSWQKIYDANRDKLENPDKIFPGQELTIPKE